MIKIAPAISNTIPTGSSWSIRTTPTRTRSRSAAWTRSVERTTPRMSPPTQARTDPYRRPSPPVWRWTPPRPPTQCLVVSDTEIADGTAKMVIATLSPVDASIDETWHGLANPGLGDRTEPGGRCRIRRPGSPIDQGGVTPPQRELALLPMQSATGRRSDAPNTATTPSSNGFRLTNSCPDSVPERDRARRRPAWSTAPP